MVATISQGPGPAGVSKVMVFIDGGYLREELKKMFGDDNINFLALAKQLAADSSQDWLHPLLFRAYYYDASPEPGEADYEERQSYLSKIRGRDNIEVRLGRLKRDHRNGRKQKGVDTLIAIDMLTKAYQHHYEIGVLLAGDNDFLDLVRAVKNAGKTINGAYFPHNVSQELADEFDRRLFLKKEVLEQLRNSKL